jgi:hypothetical protein
LDILLRTFAATNRIMNLSTAYFRVIRFEQSFPNLRGNGGLADRLMSS